MNCIFIHEKTETLNNEFCVSTHAVKIWYRSMKIVPFLLDSAGLGNVEFLDFEMISIF